MRIISWNVNGLRAVERKEALGQFLDDYSPDIFLMQETKSKPEQVEFLDNVYPEYEKFYHSAEKAGYSGISIWFKKELPLKQVRFTSGMPEDPVNDEGRIGRIDFTYGSKRFAILGIYFPNGGKSLEAWDSKLVFYEKFLDYVNKIRSEGIECIWAGDVNCAHNEIDLARPKDNDGVIGFHPDERAWLDRWVKEEWIDVWRKTFPEKRDTYSWWHLISRARSRNVGWRIDYFFVDNQFFSNIENIEYLTEQMGSDHCPVMLEF